MMAAACTVGRLSGDGPWLGFAPSLDDGYELVITDASDDAARRSPYRAPATVEDLICLAVAYFDEGLDAPPEEFAATHGDIGALVRYVAEREGDAERAAALAEAVDAIDDGLAGDAVIAALARCLGPGVDALAALERRAAALAVASAD